MPMVQNRYYIKYPIVYRLLKKICPLIRHRALGQNQRTRKFSQRKGRGTLAHTESNLRGFDSETLSLCPRLYRRLDHRSELGIILRRTQDDTRGGCRGIPADRGLVHPGSPGSGLLRRTLPRLLVDRLILLDSDDVS